MNVLRTLLYVLQLVTVMAQHLRTNLEESTGSDTSAAKADVKQRQESASLALPAEQLPDLDLLSLKPVQVMQPLEPVESRSLQLQPMIPEEQPMGVDAVQGFCCYYSSYSNDPCGNCQARDSRAWNADPSNCATSGGSYCSGVVGLFGIGTEEVAALKRQMAPAVMVPLHKLFRAFGWGAACGFASVMVAFGLVCTRLPRHDYTLVSSTDHPLLVSELQDEVGDSAIVTRL